jgi:hypothetical protein
MVMKTDRHSIFQWSLQFSKVHNGTELCSFSEDVSKKVLVYYDFLSKLDGISSGAAIPITITIGNMDWQILAPPDQADSSLGRFM